MMEFITAYLSFAFLVLCNAQDIKNPLTHNNPINVVKHGLAKSIPPDQEIVEFSKKFMLSFLDHSTIAPLLLEADNDTDECLVSLWQFFEDIVQLKPYTFKVVDAWGKLESGILRGNLKWMGLYYECINTHASNFSGKYCQTYIGEPLKPDEAGLGVPAGITIGNCLPDTCNASFIESLVSALAKNLTTNVQCSRQLNQWEATDIGGLVVLLVLTSLVVASTLYEYITERIDKGKELPNGTVLMDDSLLSATPNLENGTSHRLLTSFSLIKSTNRLLDTQRRPTDITCLHGMRFLSMSWVMLGHSFLFSISFVDNPLSIAEYFVNHGEFQAVGNAFFSVDTFFFLSGLLVVYLGLRTLERSNGKMNAPLMYLLRYVRLTPAYAFVLFMMVSVYPKLGDGPQWSSSMDAMKEPCSKYWYTNLLYFSNLYPVGGLTVECMGWSWYLANDTQFYLLAPLFLYLLYKFPIFGIASAMLTLLANLAITGAFSSYTNQQPFATGIGFMAQSFITMLTKALTTTGNTTTIYATTSNSTGNSTNPSDYSPYIQDIYAKPWCRIGAYLVGILTGYVLHRHRNIKMPKVVALLGWMVAATTACSLLYGLYPLIASGQLMDNNTAAFYNAISRPLWCVAMAWVTVACVNGYGGPINTFLSWKPFIPLSRLTYCTYLVHPLVIFWLFTTQESMFHFSIPMAIMSFLSTLVLSNMVAYVVAMLVEFPIIELMKIYQDSRTRKLPHAILVNEGSEQGSGHAEA